MRLTSIPLNYHFYTVSIAADIQGGTSPLSRYIGCPGLRSYYFTIWTLSVFVNGIRIQQFSASCWASPSLFLNTYTYTHTHTAPPEMKHIPALIIYLLFSYWHCCLKARNYRPSSFSFYSWPFLKWGHALSLLSRWHLSTLKKYRILLKLRQILRHRLSHFGN